MLFAPKESMIQYLNDKLLDPKGIHLVLNLENKIYKIGAENSLVEQNDQRVVSIEETSLFPYLIYNNVELNNITLEGILGSSLPKKINIVNFHYTIINPFKVTFNAEGEFGTLSGDFAFKDKIVMISLIPSDKMKTGYSFILNKKKRIDGDKYIFEYKL